MSHRLHPTEPVEPSATLAELATRIREGRYQVPAHQVADRILTNPTTSQAETPAPDSGSPWSKPDQHARPDPVTGPNPHAAPAPPEAATAILSPAEDIRRYHQWVDHHRRLQDTELSEITGASLTAEEVRRYHQWVHHHRSLEDTEIQELLNTPQGSPQHEDT